MSKFKIRPYDDYKAWDTAETIEEARAKRSKLAMSFFSRRVVIEDEYGNIVDSLSKESKDNTINNVDSVVPFDWNGCE